MWKHASPGSIWSRNKFRVCQAAAQAHQADNSVWLFVIPAKAGIQGRDLDSRLRGKDGQPQFQALTEH